MTDEKSEMKFRYRDSVGNLSGTFSGDTLIKKISQYKRDRFSGWTAVAAVVGLLLFWGALLATGAVLSGPSVLRATIVFASVLMFVAVWILALINKKRS